ncbi:response regulator [Rhizobium sp. SAFR-030]|uniref:response regulator n=1 Tax=Rhizobium sp. SAFR-030 TaxID=3387277 RepID=UPI003F81E7DE
MQNSMRGASGCRVLVVEDEPLLAMDIRAVLEEAGFIVLGPVPSLGDALELIHQERPDVAVLDYMLHDEPVTPAAILLKERAVPFVMASATDYSLIAGNEALAQAHNLGKPTDMGQLVKIIHGLCSAV